MTTPQQVLDFWFAPAQAARWFAHDDALDASIRQRFGETFEQLAHGRLDGWWGTLDGWLAGLIVLDQFSRNLFRNDARAWSCDGQARAAALAGIERGDDRKLSPQQRLFVYLPLEHAEDAQLQRRSVALFKRLCHDAPADQRQRFEEYLDYARRHAELIARFGRFPHRNAVLGRTSTDAELAWLARPGSGF